MFILSLNWNPSIFISENVAQDVYEKNIISIRKKKWFERKSTNTHHTHLCVSMFDNRFSVFRQYSQSGFFPNK